jgi:hypothetical protein
MLQASTGITHAIKTNPTRACLGEIVAMQHSFPSPTVGGLLGAGPKLIPF